MKQLKKIFSYLLAVCLVVGLLPWTMAGAQSQIHNVSTAEEFTTALNNAQDGDTIQISGSLLLANTVSDDSPLEIKKSVTISGGGLTLRYGGIILGEDVTFQDITLAFSNSVHNAIMANGYTLVLDNVQRASSTAWPIHLFAGGLVSDGYTLPLSGDHGTIIVRDSVNLDGKTIPGQIYAGSLYNRNTAGTSANTRSANDANDVEIEIAPSMYSSIDAIYACGAVVGSGGSVVPDPETCPVSGKVSIHGAAKNIHGKAANGNYASIVFSNDSNNSIEFANLSEISGLSVKSGIFIPKSLSFSGENTAVSVSEGARLGLNNAGNSLTVGNFDGGGELVLEQSQTLTISGRVSGETTVGIGKIFNGSSDLPINGHTYISASASDADSFQLAPLNGLTGKLERAESGDWTAVLDSADEGQITDFNFDRTNLSPIESSEISDYAIPFTLDEEDTAHMDFIPLEISVNGSPAVREEDPVYDGYFIYTSNILKFEVSDDSLVINTAGGTIPAGVYRITVTVPGTHTVSGTVITRSVDLIVTDGDASIPVPIPQAVTGLKANGTEQTGVPEGSGYTLTGHRQTEAGDYTATAVLESGYIWSDGTTDAKEILWSIAPADPTPVNPPDAPSSLTGIAPTSEDNDDGKILGTDNTMEYAREADFSDAVSCTGTEITGLTPGTYYVRYIAANGQPASEAAIVTVPEYVQTVVTVVSIELNTADYQLSCFAGDTVDVLLTGLSMEVTYSDGTVETLPVTAGMVSGFRSDTATDPGDYRTLTIIYGEQTATLPYTVTEQVPTPPEPAKYTVTVLGSYAARPGSGNYSKDEDVVIDAGTRDGFTFSGWTGPEDVVFPDASSPQTSFPMPTANVTVTANWTQDTTPPEPAKYTVTVLGSYAARPGSGNYSKGEDVVIDAGARDGFTFSGWTGPEGVVFPDASSPQTSFPMPAANVTVTANWTQDTTPPEPAKYTVTVLGSYAARPGSGNYSKGEDVVIDAGARDGFTFSGWTGPEGVVFPDASSPQTSFPMPAANVTVTANWTQDTTPPETAKYTVTVLDSYAARPGSGNYSKGEDVVIDAGTRDGFTFSGWTGPDNIEFLDASNFRTSFTMPDSAVTVTANWERIRPSSGGSSGGSGSSSGGSGSGSGSSGGGPGSSGSGSGSSGNNPVSTPNQTSGGNAGSQQSHSTSPAPSQGQSGSTFTDISAVAWYSPAVTYVSQNGLMLGTGDGRFAPEALTSRGQLVSILYRLAGSPPSSGTLSFPDTDNTAYYADAVRWSTLNSIVSGYTDGRFGPNDPVTTEQLCVFLYRYAQGRGLSTAVQRDRLSEFSDSGQISAYAADALAWAVGQGIVSGNGSGQLMPQRQTTRAQAASIIMLFCENIL